MTATLASFSAELLKLRKRPATKVLAGVLTLIVLLFGYLVIYMLVQNPPEGTGPDDLALFELLLRAENMVPVVINILRQFGGPMALILGAMAAGSEYGWSTIKTVLSQGPGRAAVLLGQILGLLTLLAIGVLLCFACAFAGSLIISQLNSTPFDLPALGELLRGMASCWLILSAWGMLGLALATLLRGTAFAVGMGLVYSLVLETLISGLAGNVSLLATLQKGLPGPNAAALSDTFPLAGMPTEGAAAVSSTHAIIVLLAYILGCALLSAVLMRRDVV